MDFLPFFEASKSPKKNRVDIWSFVALNCPCGVSKDAVESARRPCGGCIKSRCGHWRHEPWGLKGRRWKESKVYYNYCIVMNVYYIHICVYMYEYKDLNMSMYALYKKYVYIYSYTYTTYSVWKCWGPANVFRAGSSTKRKPLFNPKTGLGFRYMFYPSRFGFNWLMFFFKRVETTLVCKSQNGLGHVLAILVMISPANFGSSSEFRKGEKYWINGSTLSCKRGTGQPTITRGVDIQYIHVLPRRSTSYPIWWISMTSVLPKCPSRNHDCFKKQCAFWQHQELEFHVQDRQNDMLMLVALFQQ